ncbi:hypothetical protein AVEN_137352-1 [Araneus ventricosus]|uniref:Uncharacterized protein n=1 Tax=Araneus ventricosus TaxID=182803 RepID=A0A4Y2G9J5_ARAVE|nr:hypothetical protein AVEN_137352-1 [Araneus ventricosus]
MQNKKRWNLFRTDEAIYFHMHGYVNTQNCRIWATENLFGRQPVPLHSGKVAVWCGYTASFIEELFLFEETGPAVPVTCSVNGVRHESLLRNHVIRAHQ